MASKSQIAFFRKLYLSLLIDEDRHNLLSLQQLTGMPRRTLQDTIASLGDVGIEVEFIQTKERHNAGYYQLLTWGPIDLAWVNGHRELLLAALSLQQST
jgi:hypothetical protein